MIINSLTKLGERSFNPLLCGKGHIRWMNKILKNLQKYKRKWLSLGHEVTSRNEVLSLWNNKREKSRTALPRGKWQAAAAAHKRSSCVEVWKRLCERTEIHSPPSYMLIIQLRRRNTIRTEIKLKKPFHWLWCWGFFFQFHYEMNLSWCNQRPSIQTKNMTVALLHLSPRTTYITTSERMMKTKHRSCGNL